MGVVNHACNPSALGGQGGQIASDQKFKISLGSIPKPRLYKKIIIINKKERAKMVNLMCTLYHKFVF